MGLRVKDGKFYYYESSTQNSIFREVYEKPVYWGGGGGGVLEKMGLGQLGNLREGLAKKRGVVFLSKADTPMHTAFLIVSCKFYLLCLC